MKKILSILFVAFYLIGEAATTDDIKCEVYKIMPDQSLIKIQQLSSSKEFFIDFEKDSRYVLYFTSKNKEEKIMYLENGSNTSFSFTINFKQKESARMIYSKKEKKYKWEYMSEEETLEITQLIKD